MNHFIRYWLPVFAWSALILLTSSDLFSAHHSGDLIAAILGRFLSASQIETLNVVLRKTLHLTGYGILGALGFRAARGDKRTFALHWAVIGVAIAVSVASIDEWHQTLIPSRGGSFADVLLDAAGATTAQVIAWARNARA